MSARTYEELIAAQTELAHFNSNHDPRNGQFAKGHSGPSTNGNAPKKKLTQEQFNRLGTAAAVATVAAAKSYKSQKRTSEFLDGLVKTFVNENHESSFKPNTAKIGAAAVSAALLTYGAFAASDLYKEYKRQNPKPQSKKVEHSDEMDDELYHFNPNHDPKNGQFSKTPGGILSAIKSKRVPKHVKKKESKEDRKAEKQTLNDARNDATQYSAEFEKSVEGKKLDAEFEKAYDAYFENDNWDPKVEAELEKKFLEAEHKLLSATGRYEASKLIEKYGPEITAKIGWVDNYTDAADLIKKYGEQYVNIHGV